MSPGDLLSCKVYIQPKCKAANEDFLDYLRNNVNVQMFVLSYFFKYSEISVHTILSHNSEYYMHMLYKSTE